MKTEDVRPSALELIEMLGLASHPEGGHFREVFRSGRRVASSTEDQGRWDGGERAASTAIYFLLRSGEFSAFHRVSSDEAWHHYAGDPLELHLLDEQGHERHLLGRSFLAGERPLRVVPAGVWQAARPLPGAAGYTLCGCTVAPGFEFRDFEMPGRAELTQRFPQHGKLIATFTR